jgi:hypothetical protein
MNYGNQCEKYLNWLFIKYDEHYLSWINYLIYLTSLNDEWFKTLFKKYSINGSIAWTKANKWNLWTLLIINLFCWVFLNNQSFDQI